VDYVRGLGRHVISYNDDDEDKGIQPESILNYGCKDELSVDNGMYDGHSIDNIPDYRDVEPPLKNMYVFIYICINRTFSSRTAIVWGIGMGIATTAKGFIS
jgi:hypothetical protein